MKYSYSQIRIMDWNAFRKTNKGLGKSMQELSKEYRSRESSLSRKGSSLSHESPHSYMSSSLDDSSVRVKCMLNDYYKRKMAIVPVPKEAIDYPIPNQGFYRSTGVSNRTNFEDTYFPFAGMSTRREWIKKFSGQGIMQEHKLKPPSWFTAVCDMKLCEFPHPKQLLLYRFTEWWQIRVSVGLSNVDDDASVEDASVKDASVWNDSSLKGLKEFALKFAWIDGKFVQSPLPRYVMSECEIQRSSKESAASEINTWLIENDAMLSESTIHYSNILFERWKMYNYSQ